MSKPLTIAVTGKGGTGKTVLATLMIGMLAQRYPGQVLAIDADSASSLPYTLGIQIEKTVCDLRKGIVGSRELQSEIGATPTKEIMRSLLSAGNGFDMLAMGRPEEAGCFCAVNDLLKFGITMLADDYRITVIDGEAGPEQINRRVVESIDVLLVVADMSARSLETAGNILKAAQSAGEDGIDVKQAGLILNRVRNDRPADVLLKKIGLEVYAALPEDGLVNAFDRENRSLLELPPDSPCPAAVRGLLKKIIPDF